MKKTTLITCGILLILALNGCAATSPANADMTSQSDTTQLPNPWYDYDSLEEAQDAAGYPITLPDAEVSGIEDCETAFRVLNPDSDNSTLEIIYDNPEELRVRKAPGSDDISGDYTIYSQTEIISKDSQNITCKGNEDTFYLATWCANGYTYSVSSSSGLTLDTLIQLVTQIN